MGYRGIFPKQKLLRFFFSVHEWAHDLYQKCHKRDQDVTPKCHKRDHTNYCIKRNPTIDFYMKYMKLFVNMLSIICALLNTNVYNTSENFYFEVIWCRTHFRAMSQTWQSLHGLKSWPWWRIYFLKTCMSWHNKKFL